MILMPGGIRGAQGTVLCVDKAQFQSLDVKPRDKYLKKLKEKGISIRQLNRLTRISCSVVRRF